MREALKEARSRLVLAWAALRGHGILHGVTVEDGVITTHRTHTDIGRRTEILRNQIRTSGPVVFRGTGYVTGNTGDILRDETRLPRKNLPQR